MKTSIFCILAVFSLIYGCPRAFGQMVLFEDGRQVTDYNNKILAIAPGTQIKFSKGEIFTVEKILGSGNTTLVLEVEGQKALRIPQWRGVRSGLDPMKDSYAVVKAEGRTSMPSYIGAEPLGAISGQQPDETFTGIHKSYGETYQQLEVAGVDVPRVNFAVSRMGEYYVTEKFETKMTLQEFLDRLESFSAQEREFYFKALDKFLLTTYQLSSIGDFAPRQIGTDGKTWKLLDWRGGVEPSTGIGSPRAISSLRNHLPQEYYETADYEIMRRRSENPDHAFNIQRRLSQITGAQNHRQLQPYHTQQINHECQLLSGGMRAR